MRFWVVKIFSSLVMSLTWPAVAFANGENGHAPEQAAVDIAEQLTTLATKLVIIAVIVIAVLVVISLLRQGKSQRLKEWLFGGMLASIVAVTLFIAGSTIYVNIISETKGPVHWHADFQIFNCGAQAHLRAPQGLSNRTGTSVFHEHGDDRIHVEGVVIDTRTISLGSFFEVVGGHLTQSELAMPTDQGLLVMTNGAICPDKPIGHGHADEHDHEHEADEVAELAGKPAFLQAFLYKTESDIVTQTKLEDFADYILTPEGLVPPGDCIIFEYAPIIKDRTEHICGFYQIAIDKGELEYE